VWGCLRRGECLDPNKGGDKKGSKSIHKRAGREESFVGRTKRGSPKNIDLGKLSLQGLSSILVKATRGAY